MAVAAIEAPTADNGRALIRDRALAMGFDVVGFAAAALSDANRQNLAEYLRRGYHGDMGWLAGKAERRGDPRVLWPDARSVIALGISYAPEDDPLSNLSRPGTANISVYARGRDYHEVLKKRLRAFGRWVGEEFSCGIKIFVDTAPVMEKPLAQQAGLGWQGKHTNLVSREHGSWLFLGEVYTTLELLADDSLGDSMGDHCGSCRRCLDVCPTNAFPAPYQLDSRRCISYLTIEHAGPIDRELRPLMGNRIYGCDDCLAVCPWNKFARAGADPDLEPRGDLTAPRLAELARLDERDFHRLFSKTAVKRSGRDRFVRNVLIALGNSGDGSAVPVVESLLDDAIPVVRGAAVWALSRLVPREEFTRQQMARLPGEMHADVQSEWHSAMLDLE
ncbi:MAG: tRNA epoxyqueuosine(34) reductase QueG [Alphaproteobacteria bacterium]|nr:tRNA epoxyqueuosine(34) reductase QueG [Alphaproteobacteria bacterium]